MGQDIWAKTYIMMRRDFVPTFRRAKRGQYTSPYHTYRL